MSAVILFLVALVSAAVGAGMMLMWIMYCTDPYRW